MVCFGFCSKTIPRGRKGYALNQQSVPLKGSGTWVDDVDEEGNKIKVFQGPKNILGMEMENTQNCEKDADGLVITGQKHIHTTYDLIFKSKAYDNRPALQHCVTQHTFKDAMLPNGEVNKKPTIVDKPGHWESRSYERMKIDARAFGLYLRNAPDINLPQKEKISIWSDNCSEWLLADLSCACFNWTSVSVYATLGPNAASYIVADSGSKVLVCETKTFKLVPAMLEDETYTTNRGADLQVVVYFGKGDKATEEKLKAKNIKVVNFEEAIKPYTSKAVDYTAEDTPPEPSDLITIMYTSGTTGNPKGVMLSHSNMAATITMIDLTPSVDFQPEDVHLSYLPLAHIFERIICLSVLYKGAVVYFASNGAKGLLADLSVIKPTFFAGVPKVYENVRDAVVRKMTGAKKTLFDAAMAAKIKDMETGCGYCPIWDKLVFSKTKAALGGRVRFCVSGGAPISKETLQFVVCALAPICQGYGATETSAASTISMTWDLDCGDVGPPIGTSAIRLVDVPDMNYFNGNKQEYTEPKHKAIFDAGRNKPGGEVWIGGPGVSLGYYDPSVNGIKQNVPTNGMAKKTQEDFFMEGKWSWFKTGDIGSWNAKGCLKIVDRKKNMFKTNLGEYIPVEEIEKTYQDKCEFADFVFLPKETKVSYIALAVVVSDSIGPVMKWAKEAGVQGDEKAVVTSAAFKKKLFDTFAVAAKEKKLAPFMKIASVANIHTEYQPIGYQEDWVAGVKCVSGHVEQLLTATFKARRTQLDQYFAPHFASMYPDRPKDHILP